MGERGRRNGEKEKGKRERREPVVTNKGIKENKTAIVVTPKYTYICMRNVSSLSLEKKGTLQLRIHSGEGGGGGRGGKGRGWVVEC